MMIMHMPVRHWTGVGAHVWGPGPGHDFYVCMHARMCICAALRQNVDRFFLNGARHYRSTAGARRIFNQHNEERAKPDQHMYTCTGFKALTVPGHSKAYVYILQALEALYRPIWKGALAEAKDQIGRSAVADQLQCSRALVLVLRNDLSAPTRATPLSSGSAACI